MSMFDVDRIAAIIKPTQRMLEFLQSMPNAKEDLQLSQLRRDCTALLIPAFTGPKQAQQFIDRHYMGIFENELESWDVPQAFWPTDRSLEKFYEWFEVEFHSLVYDISAFDKIPAVQA